MGIFDIFRKRHSIDSSSLLKGGEDRHCHVLFGVDDGVKTLEEALNVLEYDENLGLTVVWCTPHVMEDIPNTTEVLRQRFAKLRQAKPAQNHCNRLLHSGTIRAPFLQT